MMSHDILETIFTILRILGIVPVAYCRKQEKLIVTRKYETYMLCVNIIILIAVEYLVIAISIGAFSNALDIYEGSKTTNSLVLIQLLECGSIQLYLSGTIVIYRYKNIEIFDKILKHYMLNFQHEPGGITHRQFYAWCILNVMLMVIFVLNLAITSYKSPGFTWLMYICHLLILTIHFVYSSVYIFCFTCVVHTINKLLRNCNEKLRVQLNPTVSETAAILRERTDLLALCSSNNLGMVYGLAMAIQSIFILSNILSFIFVTTVMYNWHKEVLAHSLQLIIPTALYSVPPLIVYANALWINNIDKEVTIV